MNYLKPAKSNIIIELLKCIERWDPRLMVARSKCKIEETPDENRYDILLVIVEVSKPDIEHSISFSLNRNF
jgi:hypothetical protein